MLHGTGCFLTVLFPTSRYCGCSGCPIEKPICSIGLNTPRDRRAVDILTLEIFDPNLFRVLQQFGFTNKNCWVTVQITKAILLLLEKWVGGSLICVQWVGVSHNQLKNLFFSLGHTHLIFKLMYIWAHCSAHSFPSCLPIFLTAISKSLLLSLSLPPPPLSSHSVLYWGALELELVIETVEQWR